MQCVVMGFVQKKILVRLSECECKCRQNITHENIYTLFVEDIVF